MGSPRMERKGKGKEGEMAAGLENRDLFQKKEEELENREGAKSQLVSVGIKQTYV